MNGDHLRRPDFGGGGGGGGPPALGAAAFGAMPAFAPPAGTRVVAMRTTTQVTQSTGGGGGRADNMQFQQLRTMALQMGSEATRFAAAKDEAATQLARAQAEKRELLKSLEDSQKEARASRGARAARRVGAGIRWRGHPSTQGDPPLCFAR